MGGKTGTAGAGMSAGAGGRIGGAAGAVAMSGSGGMASTGAGGASVVNWRGHFEPADGQTILAIGQDSASIDEYSAQVDPSPAGVMLYTNIADLAGVFSAADFGAGEDSLPHWTNETTPFVIQIGLTLVNSLDNVNAGALDANIDRLGDALKAANRPIFLRVGYEFDSDWAGYEPNAYKSAFQRIATRIRQKGATNVAFVWHAWGYYHSYNQSSAMAWYPGDDYVDWVAVSYFPGWDQNSGQSADGARNELAGIAVQQHKPFMIAESAPKQVYEPSQGQNSWNGFYSGLFSFVTAHNVKFLSYINADWDAQPLWAGKGWGDTRVQTNPYVLSQWQMTIAGSRFLHGGASLYAQLGL
jgi:hypothetical protein